VSDKQVVWIGAIVGGAVGGFLPRLWHGSALSFSGLACSTLGGLAGIWVAWKATR
jgi:hypothetical protein